MFTSDANWWKSLPDCGKLVLGVSLVRRHAKRLRPALYSPEARLAQPPDDARRGALAERALRIADIVKQTTTRPEHAMHLPVKRRGVEITRETEGRRVVEHTREGAIRELCDLLEGVANDLGDPGVGKE